MSHGITNSDSLISVRERPWHGLGVVLEQPPTDLDDALRQSGLVWAVEPQPIYVLSDGEPRPIEGHVANVRTDDGSVLGIVSERYRVIANREAFSFIASLIGSELHFETAGSLHGGRRVFVMCRLPEWIEVAGERVDQFVGLTTSHDGTGATQAAVTPIRWVCQNTVACGLTRATRKVTIRHTGDVSGKLHEARRVLDMTINYYEQSRPTASGWRWGRSARRACATCWPSSTRPGRPTPRRAARGATREAIMGLRASGRPLGNAPGSKWCAVNAIIEYQDHHRPLPSSTERFARIIDDEAFKTKALTAVEAA